MLSQEKVIEIVRMKGPVIPGQVAKIVGTNILFASAALSELVDSKKLFLTSTKVGSTPVYYAEGQESRLQELYEYLNEKDQKAFDLLKEKRILRDDELEPLMRVAMRNIKDFAVPLQISANSEKILFWKWYMIGNDEAEVLIRSHLGKEDENKKIEQEKAEEEQKKQEEETRKEEEQKKKEAEEKVAKEKKEAELREKKRQEEERRKEEEQKKKEEQRKIEEQKKKEAEEKAAKEKKEAELREKKRQEEERRKQQEQRGSEKKQEEENKEQKNISLLKEDTGDEFFNQVIKYFKENSINIVEHKVIRKKSEIDMTVRLPSVVGNLEYYCKAKNKKKVNDGDLSSAFVQGQMKKMPVLFLMTGDLTKKAKELLSTEFSKGLVVKKI